LTAAASLGESLGIEANLNVAGSAAFPAGFQRTLRIIPLSEAFRAGNLFLDLDSSRRPADGLLETDPKQMMNFLALLGKRF
jgi:hypothetical protein